jgi:hypothetical protein
MGEALRKEKPESPANDSRQFYRDLPALQKFSELTDTSMHRDLPPDWDIVISDVVGSTDAIKAGRYKDVNMVGAACIAAITNIDRSLQIPFVFGGDGATFATPRHLREKVKDALAGTRAMAKEAFGLGLRCGIVPVSEVTGTGSWVRVGKYQMSEYVTQPAFSGRGWEVAERLIKDPERGPAFMVEDSWRADEADFTGLECRWNGIPSLRDCKVALLAVSMDPDPEKHASHYNEIMNAIDRIFGSLEAVHPIDENLMDLSLRWSVLVKEASVQTSGMGFFARLVYVARIFVLDLIGLYLFARKIDTDSTKWSRYKSDFVKNSDYKKFDGMLRMVIDSTFAQRDELIGVLDRMRERGDVSFGVHTSPQAIVTCLVSDYNGNHTHFVDGSDGGYAMAAVQLKSQLKDRRSAKKT